MLRKTTVLIATGTMNAGGAETLIMEILRRRSDMIQYVMLIHYSDKKEIGVYDNEIRSLGIPMLYIHSVGSVGERRYCREFKELTKQIGHIDILHCHLNAVGGIISKAAKKAGIKNRIVHCHADITFKGSKLRVLLSEMKLTYMKHFVNKYATEFWACSNEAGKRLFNTSKKTVVIPNVIYVKDYLSDEQKRLMAKKKYNLNNSLVIGSVGRIAKIKNYELVVRTVAELNKCGKHVDFICFGRVVDENYFNEIKSLAKSLDVTNQLHFVGNSKNIPFDISCIDIFFMPSYSEGFGMAALEAQAAGIYTLVSDKIPKIVDMKLGAISFLSIENENEWIDAVLNFKPLCLDNDKILEKFNENGFNSETMVQKIEKLYDEMVNF